MVLLHVHPHALSLTHTCTRMYALQAFRLSICSSGGTGDRQSTGPDQPVLFGEQTKGGHMLFSSLLFSCGAVPVNAVMYVISTCGVR